MRSTCFLKSLTSRVCRSGSTTVAPLPIQTQFCEEITTKLNALRSWEQDFGSSSWLVGVVDVAIDTQKATQEQLIKHANNIVVSEVDREVIEAYLEDNVEMLDACNRLVEKIDMVHGYANSLQASTRSHEIMFKECGKLEAQCATLDKCSPKLSKLMGRKEASYDNEKDQELHQVLSGSREVASMSCQLLQRALSFKSRQGLLKSKSKLPTTTWATSLNQMQENLNQEAEKRKKSAPWIMNELQKMVMNARLLQDQLKSHKGSVDIDDLRRSCRALEQDLKPLEERVKELYRHLISIRMALLGILSKS